MKCLALLAPLLIVSGCATAPGQFAALEWDSRSKEQIEASTPADTAVYQTGAKDAAQPRAFTEWKALFDLISGLRVRIRFVYVQWGAGK